MANSDGVADHSPIHPAESRLLLLGPLLADHLMTIWHPRRTSRPFCISYVQIKHPTVSPTAIETNKLCR